MAASIVAWYEVSDWFVSDSPKTITGISWEAGDIIVVAGGTENGVGTVNTPTNANLTFTEQQDVDISTDYCAGRLFTAQAGSTQTGQTISVTGSYSWGFCVWVVRGNNLVVRQSSSGGGTTSSYSLPVAENSVVCYALFDWNASNPPGKTPATGSGTATERLDDGDGASYAQYICDWEGTSAGTYSFGPNNYTSLRATDFVIEIADYTEIAADDFNRANETLTTSSNWASWAGWPTPSIVSNKVQSSTGSDQGSYWVGDTFDDDQWVEFDSDLTGSTGYSGNVAWLRHTADNTFYAAEHHNGSSGTLTLSRVTSGAGWESIGSSVTSVGLTGRLRLEAVGTQITVYFDGVEEITQSDSTHTGGGPAFHTFTSGGTSTTIDNFSAGDWTPPPSVNFRIAEAVDFGDTNFDLSPDPATGDILIAVTSESNSSGDPGGSSITANMGGTWSEEQNIGWAGRRRQKVYINDNWTTASATETITYAGNQDKVSVGIVVEGAVTEATYEWVEAESSNDGYYPTLEQVGPYDKLILILSNENDSAMASVSDGWTQIGTALTGGSGVRRFSIWEHTGYLADLTPTFYWGTAGGYAAWIGRFRFPENEIATDDFNRSNQEVDASANWTQIPFLADGNQIVSNTVVGKSDTDVGDYWTTPFSTTDGPVWVEVDVVVNSAPSFDAVGPVLLNSSANDFLQLAIYEQGATDEYLLWHYDGGSWTQYAVTSRSGTYVNETLRMEYDPNEGTYGTVHCYSDGAEIISWAMTSGVHTALDLNTETTFTYAGLQHYDYGNGGLQNFALDNFSAGDWTTATGGPSPQTMTGTALAVDITAASGSFTPGAVTWTGTAATVNITAATGSFRSVLWSNSVVTTTDAGASPQTMTGTAATVQVTATSGSFTPGAVTVTGTAASVTVTATSGTFTAGATTMTGTALNLGVSAPTGSFVPSGEGIWNGTNATVAVTATSDSFTAGAATVTGTATSLSVTADSGSFTAPGSLIPGNLRLDITYSDDGFDADTIAMLWDSVPSATGYDIERNGTIIVFDHPTNDYTDTGLDPDTEYTHRVRAVF